MKNKIVFEIVFMCILGITGLYLFDVMKQIKLNNHELKEIDSHKNTVFSNGSGIDIAGNEIDAIDVSKELSKGVAAFLLRSKNVDADIKFWNEVNDNLSELDEIRLTGYCEDEKCIESVKKNPNKAKFIILEYGETTDMQAIINADENDEFWLIGFGNSEKIKWHDGIITPLDIVRSIDHERKDN